MALVHFMTRLAQCLIIVAMALIAACQAPVRGEPVPPPRADVAPRPPSAPEEKPSAPDARGVVSPAEQAEIAGVKVALRGCQLTVQTAAGADNLTIDLPEPCSFGRKPDGSVHVVQTKQCATALVISSRPSAEHTGDCDTRKRAVVVDHGRVKISAKEKKSAGCNTTGPFDEPLFIVLAAST